MTSPYRPEFEAALRIFARVSGAMKARGFAPPVLGRCAAVELYSASAIVTGGMTQCRRVTPARSFGAKPSNAPRDPQMTNFPPPE